jgi:hypothetical protein
LKGLRRKAPKFCGRFRSTPQFWEPNFNLKKWANWGEIQIPKCCEIY